MKALASATLVLTSLLLFPTICSAEKAGWTVITSSMDTLNSCAIGTIEDGNVHFIRGISVIKMPVDSVKIVSRRNESRFWSGAGYGALAGAATGAIVGLATYQKPTGPFAIDFGPGIQSLGIGILGGVAGFAVGGVVGAISGADDRYDLTHATTREKTQILLDLRGKSR